MGWRASPGALGMLGGDLWLVARAYVDLTRMAVALRRRGFQGVLAETEAIGVAEGRRQSPPSARDLRRARRYGRRIAEAARIHPERPRCLHRSLVLDRWLRREGLPSELRIGVAKAGDTLRAHAWVELGGQVVNDHPAAVADFLVLCRPLTPREPSARGWEMAWWR